MRYRNLILASALTVAALAIAAAVAFNRLPPGAQLPTHWGLDGHPDRFAGAGFALFMPVAATALVSLVMAALPALEPLQDRLAQSAPLYRTAWAGLLGIMVLVEAMVAAPAFGLALTGGVMLFAMGLFLIALGNVLPKSRPGFFVGIRTPWAIVDADNWIATHRYGGRIMMAAGVAIVVLAALPIDGRDRAACVTALVLMTAATPVLYSFFYWWRAKRT